MLIFWQCAPKVIWMKSNQANLRVTFWIKIWQYQKWFHITLMFHFKVIYLRINVIVLRISQIDLLLYALNAKHFSAQYDLDWWNAQMRQQNSHIKDDSAKRIHVSLNTLPMISTAKISAWQNLKSTRFYYVYTYFSRTKAAPFYACRSETSIKTKKFGRLELKKIKLWTTYMKFSWMLNCIADKFSSNKMNRIK